uniref:Vacuolar protein sorting-associated protein VTA1 n=1 Tax=Parastrongyloides trichosuri TaxID=131310 RepID=A0A0N4ZM33_PARTI
MANVPPNLKSISPYIKLSKDYVNRDPSIYYWCILYSVQQGLKCQKSPDGDKYLGRLLSTLEKMKADFSTTESIIHSVAGQAHLEENAYKLFNYADQQDRLGNFDIKTIKSFYTSGLLFDVLTQFGELDENFASARKYAKWKATYINNCLKNGEKPVPGPPNGSQDNDMDELERELRGLTSGNGGSEANNLNYDPNNFNNKPLPSAPTSAPDLANIPMNNSSLVPPSLNSYPSAPVKQQYSSENDLLDYANAKKFAKYAISAMDYEDRVTAIDNLQKALAILQQ